MMRSNRETRRWGPRWRRQAAGIAAGLCALVLSASALALATALQSQADERQVVAVAVAKSCPAQLEPGCGAP